MWAVLFAGCSVENAEPNRTERDLPGASLQTGGVALVDVASLPATWTTAAGASDPAVLDFVDFDGDGILDAVVKIMRDEGGSALLLVAGPLMEPKTIPGDEFASIEAMPYMGASDQDDDGIVDLGIGWGDGAFMPGPLRGALDPLDSIPATEARDDWDGDGTPDVARWVSNVQMSAWYGPVIDTAGPPDLDLTFGCGSVYANHFLNEYPNGVRFWPDITGDGVADGTAPGFFDTPDCQGYVFQIPRTGTLNPLDAPTTAVGVEGIIEVVPDQSGDGQPDVWLRDQGTILASPVTVQSHAPVTGALIGALDPALDLVVPTTVDFDGDGLADFLALAEGDAVWTDGAAGTFTADEFVGGEVVVVVHGGGSGLADRSYDILYDFGRHPHGWETFLEGGRVGLPATVDGHIVMVDLGPGAIADAVAPLE